MSEHEQEPGKSSRGKLVGVIVVAALVAGLGFVFLKYGLLSSGKGKAVKKPKPLVTVQKVQLGSIAEVVELTGSVEPVIFARLASPAEGPVLRCTVREGDKVTKGEKIVLIGRKSGIESLLKSAEEDLKAEKEELERIEKLVESGAVPKDQLQNQRAKYMRMQAQFERMKESNADYDIVIPWDGVVSKVLVAVGNYVNARTVLVEIFDPKSLVIKVAVPEAQSQQVSFGMETPVILDAYPGKTFHGKVSRIYPDLDRKMRTRTIEITLADPVELAPGMFARVEIPIKRVEQTIVVPQEAVLVTIKEKKIAFVIENGKAVQREVVTGIESKGKVQILKGLEPGEELVVAGNERLKTGMEVSILGKPKPGAPPKKSPESAKEGAAK
ncbi:MAG: efflux RND transporter periplasmic adaptor subunit [Desulfomonilaceae bacterium]